MTRPSKRPLVQLRWSMTTGIPAATERDTALHLLYARIELSMYESRLSRGSLLQLLYAHTEASLLQQFDALLQRLYAHTEATVRIHGVDDTQVTFLARHLVAAIGCTVAAFVRTHGGQNVTCVSSTPRIRTIAEVLSVCVCVCVCVSCRRHVRVIQSVCVMSCESCG